MYEEKVAYELAKKLYDGFFNTLMEAVANSVKNFEKAKSYKNCNDPVRENYLDGYYKGKIDAFNEISERISKEHFLEEQELMGWLNADRRNHMDEATRKAVKGTWKDYVFNTIHAQKNREADDILPDRQFRGKQIYEKIMRMRGRLANLFEGYAGEGFELGRKYENDILKIEDVKAFDPKKFSKTCIETFVPEDYEYF